MHQAHQIHGPFTRYRSSWVRPNWCSRRSLICCGTSRRSPAGPLRRSGAAGSRLQRRAQVLYLFLVDEQLAVTRNAELIASPRPACRRTSSTCAWITEDKEDEVVGRHRRPRAAADHPRQHARRLNDRNAGGRGRSVLAGELDRKVQALVEHAWERMRRIEADRREHRHHFAQKVVADPTGPVRARSHRARRKRMPSASSAGEHLRVEGVDTALRRAHALRARLLLEHVLRPMRSGPIGAVPASNFGLHACDADFEGLVEIARKDAEELETLEDVGVLGLQPVRARAGLNSVAGPRLM